jgi:MOSC domain-containing protein YiiM
MRGIITRIGAKPETEGESGLPKSSLEYAIITKGGIYGDYNRYRAQKKENTPDQALLIHTVDKIVELNEEGWPVLAGDLGENFTIAGLRYEDIRPGQQYGAPHATFEITMEATPCKTLAELPYVGKERIAAFIKTLVGRRGWYAKVITPGIVRIEEIVRLRS